jgi:hypothetical protein
LALHSRLSVRGDADSQSGATESLNHADLDYKKMNFNIFGPTMHLMEESTGPIEEIIA